MKQLYMGLTLLRIHNHEITVSSAGMPPVYIYNKESKEVKEILLKGMPLGAAEDFSYQQTQMKLSPGDTILLMTDGFPELFNEHDEILDYPKVKAHFKEIADRSPNEIISHLNNAADQWRGDKPLKDDMTFVVLKYKND